MGRGERSVMRVTLVQGIVSSFDEELAPLEESGRKEREDGTEDDLLEERGLDHTSFRARAMP